MMTQTATSTRLINAQEIRKAYNLLVTQPGQIVEIRALEASRDINGRWPETLAGFFNNINDLLKEISSIKQAFGIYITLQTCHNDLLDRAENKLIKQRKGGSTSDGDITAYQWLAIDCDPDRKAGISSTNQEHDNAIALARRICDELLTNGWPAPTLADSGNGAHLLYRIEVPVTDADLVKRTLEGLAARFDTDLVHVDQTMFNPSRIIKLYGTLACKGDNTTRRPHRLSRILETPDTLQIVPRDLLEALATPVQQPQSKLTFQGYTPSREHEDFRADKFLQKHHIAVKNNDSYEGGTRYLLQACAWDSSHTDNSACVYQFVDGRLGASCSHNSCKGKGWKDFRLVFEPDAYTQKITPAPRKKKKQAPANNNNNNTSTPDQAPTEIDLCRYDPDDSGNADAMFALFGEKFLYCSTVGWLMYTGTHWEVDTDGFSARRHAIETLRRRRHAAVDARQESIVKCTAADEKKVNGCVNLFKTLVSININKFDADPDALNCKNGVVDMRTGSVTPHHFNQRFTYCLNYAYEYADDTQLQAFLHAVVGGGQEVIDYLQMLCGYSFTGHTREEILIYLFGPTRAGKGTFAELFLKLLPTPLSKGVDFNTFTAKREGDISNFDLAPLKPCRLIFASESQKSQSLNPAKIKALTGGDDVMCCFKHRDFFSYKPQYQVWMLSNWPVNGDPEDDALWGRVRVIEFPNSFLGKEDKALKGNMQSEEVLKSALYWTVQGAIKWYALGSAGLSTPPSVQASTVKQRAYLDYVQKWLDDCTEEDPEGWTANEVVTASYLAWCTANNVQYPKGAKALASSLKSKGYVPGVQKRTNGKNRKGVQGFIIGDNTHEDSEFEENFVTGNGCNGRNQEVSSRIGEIEKTQILPLQPLPVTLLPGSEDEYKKLYAELRKIPDDKLAPHGKMVWYCPESGYEQGPVTPVEYARRLKVLGTSEDQKKREAGRLEMLKKLGREDIA